MQFVQTMLSFILALGVLVTVHEFGHFWVARRLGVKCLRFSVGFGKALWRRQWGETEFVLAAVPLGGYVKMLDEREGEVAASECHRAFNRQPLFTRTAVVVAGPMANFLLAFVAYWLTLVIGISGPKPIVGAVEDDSIAARAGLTAGAEIVAVENVPTQTWDGVFRKSLEAILDGDRIAITYAPEAGFARDGHLDFSALSIDDISEGDFLAELGVTPLRPMIDPVIERVVPDGAAARAGLLSGDRIVSADGVAVASWSDWVVTVRGSPDRTLALVVERAGQELDMDLTPVAIEDGDTRIGRIGAEVRVPEAIEPVPMGIERYGPGEAIGGALQRTADMSVTTLKFLGKMVTGQASVQNLSGPISIAHYAGQSARMGTARFLEFLALVSVSLAVLNLLPIPLLDGGHLLYYLIEFVTRRPVSETVQVYGQQVGLVVLLSLMGLAVYNDILRIL